MGRVIPFVASVLVTSIAGATVLVPAEFSEIVGGSEIIAYARIVDVRPEWADGRRWIDSVVTAEVVTYLKGGPDETITFNVPGGQTRTLPQRRRWRAGVCARRRGGAVPQVQRDARREPA